MTVVVILAAAAVIYVLAVRGRHKRAAKAAREQAEADKYSFAAYADPTKRKGGGR